MSPRPPPSGARRPMPGGRGPGARLPPKKALFAAAAGALFGAALGYLLFFA